jgi:hypothetical protein
MNLYLISNPKPDYETYTDVLIVAENEGHARALSFIAVDDDEYEDDEGFTKHWVDRSKANTLIVRCLGESNESEAKIIKTWYKNG